MAATDGNRPYTATIDDATTGDLADIAALNVAATPHVGDVDAEFFDRWVARAYSFRVVRSERAVVAFLLAFDQHAEYGSPNFQWFRGRYRRFAYIDRVAVRDDHQRLGLGRTLYEDLIRHSTLAGQPRITCEVNLRPPNPVSLGFHEALGFTEVGQQDLAGGAKRVAMLARTLP